MCSRFFNPTTTASTARWLRSFSTRVSNPFVGNAILMDLQWIDDASPFGNKVRNILNLKGVPYAIVKVSSIPPRRQLIDLLGLHYRRIPVLAIGRDVYCDTSLIAAKLEERFPATAGYRTIFPPLKSGGGSNPITQQLLALAWTDRMLFPKAAATMPWSKVPRAFVEDRSKFAGRKIDPKTAEAALPFILSSLAAQVELIEEQLADGREWFLDTIEPSFADISAHFPLEFARGLTSKHNFFDSSKFPRTVEWIERVDRYLVDCRKNVTVREISGEEAAQTILNDELPTVVPVTCDTELSRLGLKVNDTVAVIPDDTGKEGVTVGVLLCVDRKETIVQINGPQGSIRVHFPRIGYVVAKPKALARL